MVCIEGQTLVEDTVLYNGAPVTPQGANKWPGMCLKADVHTHLHTPVFPLKHKPIINWTILCTYVLSFSLVLSNHFPPSLLHVSFLGFLKHYFNVYDLITFTIHWYLACLSKCSFALFILTIYQFLCTYVWTSLLMNTNIFILYKRSKDWRLNVTLSMHSYCR